MRATPDGQAWRCGRTPLVPPSRALIQTIAAYQMKYRLGIEDDGWRGMIGVEVVAGIRTALRGLDVQFNGRCHYMDRQYFERCT